MNRNAQHTSQRIKDIYSNASTIFIIDHLLTVLHDLNDRLDKLEQLQKRSIV